MKWFPVCNYTHYSLLRGFSKPKDLVEKCKLNGYRACGIADHHSISGAVSFYQHCVANDIKPIIGCSFDGFSLFAKNKKGWFELIEIVSSFDEDGGIALSSIEKHSNNGNLICVSRNKNLSYLVKNGDFYKKTDSFYDTYYVNKSDANLHRILLCSNIKTTLPKIYKKIKSGETVPDQEFFENAESYLYDNVEICEVLLKEPESGNIFDEIYSKCEYFNILEKPQLPKFPTPNNESEEEYLRQLCREGWKKLLAKTEKSDTEEKKKIYGDRFKKEFDVIKDANLFGYFLIVRDIIKYANDQGWMTGPGRGSAAGCLISYLLGITHIDPIEYDLLFERFYNSGRNTEDHVSLPDIDIDVPADKRDDIISYLKEKYGQNNVGQMLTFGRLQGRSAIKEVLRIHEACGFGEMNEITKYIPDEAAISDQLQEMDEDEKSIIKWALLNRADDLRDFCFINSNGELDGVYSEYFKQAIDIEGTFKTQGKHAAGVVISANELHKVCPMVNQKNGKEKIAGLEMADLEALGHVKFDVLGLSLLQKLMFINDIVPELKGEK